MNIKEFLNRNNLRKVNKDLNEGITYHWADDSKVLKVEHTHFSHEQHLVGYSLNGKTSLVELNTSLFECTGIRLDRNWSTDYMSVYLNTTTRGHMTERKTMWVVRNKKNGKRETFYELNAEQLRRAFGGNPVMEIEHTEQAQVNGNVVQLFKSNESFSERTEKLNRFYDRMYSGIRYGNDSLNEVCETQGYSLIDEFEYTKKLSFTPEFIKQTARYIEIGWQTNSTYYSHPNTLKISKCNEVKTVKLQDIGTETSGYYDHHTKMECRPEQVDAIKAFTKRFKRNHK